jgi:hypothetical protein
MDVGNNHHVPQQRLLRRWLRVKRRKPRFPENNPFTELHFPISPAVYVPHTHRFNNTGFDAVDRVLLLPIPLGGRLIIRVHQRARWRVSFPANSAGLEESICFHQTDVLNQFSIAS